MAILRHQILYEGDEVAEEILVDSTLRPAKAGGAYNSDSAEPERIGREPFHRLHNSIEALPIQEFGLHCRDEHRQSAIKFDLLANFIHAELDAMGAVPAGDDVVGVEINSLAIVLLDREARGVALMLGLILAVESEAGGRMAKQRL